jgi:arsenate reductase (glutaredoxin)
MSSIPARTTTTPGDLTPQPVRIYHNPACARSREALEYLQQQGIQPEIVEYLENPLGVEELRQLIRMLGMAPSSLIRTADFRRLNLSPTNDYEQLLNLLADHPVIMDRPIVVVGDQARIGRPLENLHELFSNSPLHRRP